MIVEIVFAAGCFWGVEKHFEQIDGVIDVKSGYVGGNYTNPTYKNVLKYRSLKNNSKIINHTEAVHIKFDNSKVNAQTLIKSFWELHNPTQLNRQGNDIGNNYRSALFYTNENQHKIALNTKDEYQALLTNNGYGNIVTEIKPLIKFYDAENYHQDYLQNNPNGYCPNHSTGVKFDNKDKEYYKNLGALKWGKESETYKIAFNKGTENRFCTQYDIFKDTPDGVFVDKLSGDILFDTNDRFNSHSGWLSFYKAVDNATIQKEDNSYGMKRIEVIARKSGIHLGHVFPREDGTNRFCINATVLDFIPRDILKTTN